MRVIAGKARSLPLITPEGMETRPTTDRIRETLFNMLQPELADSRFLDLFSGSGAVGIEALSRGAESAVFIEQSKRACTCIRRNLEFTGFTGPSRLICGDVLQALVMLEGVPPFDLIFMDPPYRKGFPQKVLAVLAEGTLADSSTLIIVEEALDTDFSFLEATPFCVIREKKYKTNKHLFIRRK